MCAKGKAVVSAVCICLLLLAGRQAVRSHVQHKIPSLAAKERTLLRIWAINAPGGAQQWIKQQLKLFEKRQPGVSTYLRTVSAQELSLPDAVLPDVILYMPGDIQDPSAFFVPLSGETAARGGLLQETLLRCGRWRNVQYGLPLCWGAWVLAIDSTLEPGSASTPAPTTLLGRPAATSGSATTPEPGYPLSAAMKADCALQSPGGTALFSLGLMLDQPPPLPDNFGTLPSGAVYDAFRKRECVTAVLTTGQAAAFSALTAGGNGFPHRIMTAEEIITDQVWLASVTPDAPPAAALLLSFLASADAQKALVSQELHTVRRDLVLYTSGTAARVEQTARKALCAVNAYIPAAEVHAAAWQYFTRQLTLDEALLPLL